ncbi:NAD kinase [Kutzneria chonburiensis]|uniref:NAD kinase n=1 Tax=Kutzneria chonburiensis TaxID=1483604 RepID=A0ABV6N0T5_9PSEU|nr:NAD kinase [Kutzneria chonburiensis]
MTQLNVNGDREILLVVKTGRQTNLRLAEKVAGRFAEAGIRLRVVEDEAADLDRSCYAEVAPASTAAVGTELVFALGGDGTLLRAAELARPYGTPVLGVNLGRVGFLVEADMDDLDEAVQRVIDRSYHVEERMTLDVAATVQGEVIAHTWALNEASVEKSSRERVLDVVVEVDARPVSAYGCDGVLCATPSGSTAYAFSAGGPVVWPDLDALLVVPSNAHALFARPFVVSPNSVVAFEIDPHGHPAVLCCDGRRLVELPAGTRVEVAHSSTPVKLVRLKQDLFSDRLVNKFALPVQGWRGPVLD